MRGTRRHPGADGSRYPVERRLLAYGLCAVPGAGLFFGSWLAGLSFLVLLAAIGALVRRDEPPFLAYCIVYQWLFVMAGYLWHQRTGDYPGAAITADLDTAVTLSLIGLVALVAGIRFGLLLLDRRFGPEPQRPLDCRYDAGLLFGWVIALYTVDWILRVSPMAIAFGAAQIIQSVLALRDVLLCLLFMIVLRERRGYSYAAIAAAYAGVPELSSGTSGFSQPLILGLIATLGLWRPGPRNAAERAQNRRVGALAAAGTAGLLSLALLWQGALKAPWRAVVRSEMAAADPTTAIADFFAVAGQAAPAFDLRDASESLAARLSSDLLYFSFVVDRVPDFVPHERGELTWRAIRHISAPRFLFPEKENLGGDSWLILRYAGVQVAGDESQTSIGLGYIPEFYIDFGAPWMFIAVFALGVLLGSAVGALRFCATWPDLHLAAATVIATSSLAEYGSEIAKLLGGFIMQGSIFAVALYLGATKLEKRLAVALPPRAPAPAALPAFDATRVETGAHSASRAP